jgi:hypothetical protein
MTGFSLESGATRRSPLIRTTRAVELPCQSSLARLYGQTRFGSRPLWARGGFVGKAPVPFNLPDRSYNATSHRSRLQDEPQGWRQMVKLFGAVSRGLPVFALAVLIAIAAADEVLAGDPAAPTVCHPRRTRPPMASQRSRAKPPARHTVGDSR